MSSPTNDRQLEAALREIDRDSDGDPAAALAARIDLMLALLVGVRRDIRDYP